MSCCAHILLLFLPAAASLLLAPQLHTGGVANRIRSPTSLSLMSRLSCEKVMIPALHLVHGFNPRELETDLLRLRGGKKGTAAQGKRGTGHKAHPSYKYNLSYPRKSRADGTTWKRYTIKKNPQGSGRMRHMREVFQRFKNGFRCSPPYQGPAPSASANAAAPS